MSFWNIVFYLITVSFGLYLIIILYYSYGWFSLGNFNKTFKTPFTQVSVIVAVRNERNNILNCLTDIIKQDYPAELFELIVVDDASEDHTAQLVEEFIEDHPEKNIRLIYIKDKTRSSKKHAITEGISRSAGTFIVTTDADCRMNEQWLSSLVNYYETFGVSMIAGPVCMNDEGSVFQKLQSLEFFSLVVVGAASITLNNPILCNGANLAYEKSSFDFLKGFKGNEKYASGDDIFLLQKIKKQLHERIGFIRNVDSIVYTSAEESFRGFIQQRVRWISKSKAYKDFFTIFTAVIVFSFNLLLLCGFILGLFNPLFLKIVLFFFSIKLFIDLPLLAGITYFMGRSKLLLYYLPLQMLNVFYVSIVGFYGNFAKYNWKGRRNL